ncbi:hypothetical protein J6590_012984 [Homalodisca vitripennis]|nr:hypothetical protein J6590_012984 [Homalodisca vitripennis]
MLNVLRSKSPVKEYPKSITFRVRKEYMGIESTQREYQGREERGKLSTAHSTFVF